MPRTDGLFQDALDLGRENEEFISLGKAWCTNIRRDRGMLGVGVVEEVTGLPVAGGSFACDFARNPSTGGGMRLANSALVFYEDNCRNCEDRSPGDRVPNLGTWAEGLIADRKQREEAEAEKQRVAAQEQQRRISQRRAVGASLDAAAQEVVGLINRLDANRWDQEALDALRTTARLAPDAFPDQVKDLLYQDARLLEMPVFVEVLSELDSVVNPPELHSLCVTAVRERWAIAEGCRYLSEHAEIVDVTGELVEVVVFHAIPRESPFGSAPGKPDALLRFHSLAPENVEMKIAFLLRHGESRNRAAGASATQVLFSVDPSVGDRLLSALLDSLRLPEGFRDEHRPARKTALAISEVLGSNPAETEAAVQGRWVHATSIYRARLVDVYSELVSSQDEHLPPDVAQLVFSRVMSALQEPSARSSDLRDDYQFKAAELVGRVVRKSRDFLPPLESLLGLWLDWMARREEVASLEPEYDLGALDLIGHQMRIRGLTHRLSGAIVAVAKDDPSGFLTVCGDVYRGAESTPLVQAEVVRMAGEVASKSSHHISDALPLIYTAMLGNDQVIRAAGMEAAGQVIRGLQPGSVPPLLATALATGLSDRYLIVIKAAVKAIRTFPPHLVSSTQVAVNLLLIASAYATDRDHEDLVKSALTAALHLAQHDERIAGLVRKKTLLVIDTMPVASARDMLVFNPSLMQEDEWVSSAIKTMRIDDDPDYEYLSAEEKDKLVVLLAQRRLSESHVELLMSSDFAARPPDPHRSLVAADFFGEIHRPELSAQIVRSALRDLPDTVEQRFTRRQLSLGQCMFELEVAIAAGDSNRRARLVEKAGQLCHEDI